MHAKYGRTERNISLKGASSPLLKHHDRLTAEHSQRNRCPGARSFHGLVRRRSRCPRCSRAGGRAICTCVGTSFLGPFLGPFSIVTRRRHRLCFCKTRPHSTQRCVVLYTSRRVRLAARSGVLDVHRRVVEHADGLRRRSHQNLAHMLLCSKATQRSRHCGSVHHGVGQ